MIQYFGIAFTFGCATLVLLAISPLGRALGDRIRGGGRAERGDARVEDILTDLRRELAELAERVDFLERLSAGPREAPRISPR